MKANRLKWIVPLVLLLLAAGCGGIPAPLVAAPSPAGPSEEPTPVPPPGTTAVALPPPAGAITVDNSDPDFTIASGVWGTCQGSDCGGTPYGSDFRFADPGCTDCQARYAFQIPRTGNYEVWAWLVPGEDRATDTPFTLSCTGGPIIARVDQRNNDNGWYSLGTWPFAEGPASVLVAASGSGYANADAVAVTPAGSGPPTRPDVAPAATADTGGAAEPTAVPTEPPAVTAPPPPPASGALVIDHTCTDIGQIPAAWLERAKELAVHYAHTSHGSQIVTGLEWLKAQDPRYNAAVRYCGDDAGLPDEPGALRVCDGNPPEDYIEPDDYWSTDEGIQRTRAVADTGLFNFSMWSWCGQQSENDAATVQQYLDTLDQLEAEYPAMRFIYMTGHTDGGSEALARNNDLVRQYARSHGKVLFDFADFESYDPAGNYYPDAADSCIWCDAWCSDHPQDCANLDQIGDCAHTHPLQCKLKAQAFWWLMARLAGWDGQP